MKTFTFLLLISFSTLSLTGQNFLSSSIENPSDVNADGVDYQYMYNLQENIDYEDPVCSRNYMGKNLFVRFQMPESGTAKIELTHKNSLDHGMSIIQIENGNTNLIQCVQAIDKNSIIYVSDSSLANQYIICRIWINEEQNQGNLKLKISNEEFIKKSKVPVVGVMSATPQELVENVLISGCVQAQNVQFTGAPESIGYFTNGTPGLDFSSGIILSSGSAMKVVGPNNSPATCTNLEQPGDDMLTEIINRATFDAAILEFDFIPSENSITFQYAFGSEEYEEYVGGVFNDIFTFHISGGPENYQDKNIALLPGTIIPVSINNVNHLQNSEYYYNNDNGEHLQYDGMTVTLTAYADVTPCETYHIRLAIADAADPIFDSGVFLKAGSFSSGTIPLVKNINDWVMVNTTYEGCSNNLNFVRSDNNNISTPLEFNIEITGSAISDDDYSAIPLNLVIPAGEESISVPYDVFEDIITEGEETINIKIYTGCNCGLEYIEETLLIRDKVEITGQIIGSDPVCAGDTVNLELQLDELPEYYEVYWSDGTIGDTSLETILFDSGDVVAEVHYPCGIVTFSTFVEVKPVPEGNATTNSPLCAGDTLAFESYNGVSYLWKGPDAFFTNESNPTFEDVSSTQSGSYGVTVTGSNGCQYTQMFDVQINDLPIPNLPSSVDVCENSELSINPGSYYSYQWVGPNNWLSDNSSLEISNISMLHQGNYYVTVSDNIGCTGSTEVDLIVKPSPTANVSYNFPICEGDDINFIGNGDGDPYWTLPDGSVIENINYIVSNADENDSGDYMFLLNNVHDCKDSVLINIDVTIPDATILTDASFCTNQESVQLLSLYENGTWSGTNISQSGNFDLTGLSDGFYEVFYHIGFPGCEDAQSQAFQVENPPIVSVTPINSVCNNETEFLIDVIPTGGEWTGVGIQDSNTGLYNPFGLNPNDYNLSYTITTDICTVNTIVPITILQGVDASITDLDPLCEFSENIYLTATTSGGYWYGPGIENNFTGNFNPLGLAPGVYTIHYDVNNSSCSDTDSTHIIIGEYITSDMDHEVQVCDMNQNIFLTATNNTGYWSGQGIVDQTTGEFNPADCGLGEWNVYYFIDNGGCHSVDSVLIIISEINSSDFILPTNICQYQNPYYIIPSHSGGNWSGSGIEDSLVGVFNPELAGVGVHEITYTTNNFGCISSNSEYIEVLIAPDPTFNTQNMFCATDIPVQLVANTPNGMWSGNGITDAVNGIFDPSIVGSGNTLVNYTVSNTNCTSFESQYFWVIDGSESMSINIPDTICIFEPQFELDAQPEGGIWTGSGIVNTDEFDAAIAGSGYHDITYTIGNGTCEASLTKTVFVQDTTAVYLMSSSEFCAESDSQELESNILNGFWFGEGVLNSDFYPEMLSPGQTSVFYSYQIGSCNLTKEFQITILPISELEIVGLKSTYCENEGEAFLDFSPSGGIVSDIDFSLNNSFNTTNLSLGQNNITYNYTSANGCTSEITESFEILEAPEVSVTGIQSDYCINSNDISFHAIPYGGLFEGVETAGNSISITSTGIGEHFLLYSYTAPNGCSDYYLQSIYVHELPEVSFEITNTPSCYGYANGEIELITNELEPYIVSWEHDPLTTIATIDNLSTGWYHATITSSNNCINSDSVFLDQPDSLLVETVGTSTLLCHNSNNALVEAIVEGGIEPYSFDWSTLDENHTSSISGIGAGVYYLSVTDANSCESIISHTIYDGFVVDYLADSNQQLDCFGDQNGSINIQVDDQENCEILWSDNDTSFLRNNLEAGYYHFTVTGSNDCTVVDSIEIFQPDSISVFSDISNVTCGDHLGGIITQINGGQAPYSYTWSNGNTSNVLLQVPVGIYTLQVKDNNDCVSDFDFEVVATNSILVEIDVESPNLCFGDSVAILLASSVNGITPLEYTWSDGSINASLENIESGIYQLTITDVWGCIGESFIEIQDPEMMDIETTVNMVRCKGESNGSVQLSINGGTGDYIVNWSDGTNAEINTGLSSGIYSYTVTDSNDCIINGFTEIIEPEYELSLAIEANEPSCFGLADGSILAHGKGGTAPYVYNWSYANYVTDSRSIEDLPSGDYSIILVDSHSCVQYLDYNLNEPEKIEADYIANPPSCRGSNDANFEVMVTGGTEPYIFNINETDYSNKEFFGQIPGVCGILIQDNNLCTNNVNVVIPESDLECLVIPNAFTPNGDGVNDKWIIDKIEMFPYSRVQVFNRWGQKIFETNSENTLWDGYTQMGECPVGTYFYIIDLMNGTQAYTGMVSIVK